MELSDLQLKMLDSQLEFEHTTPEVLAAFGEFLVKHSAAEKYICNVNSVQGWLRGSGCYPHKLLNTSFQWAAAPEGGLYWRDLDTKWKYKCYNDLFFELMIPF